MDYEQDYSTLAIDNNRWYNRRALSTRLTPVPDEEKPTGTEAVILDNEDFA